MLSNVRFWTQTLPVNEELAFTACVKITQVPKNVSNCPLTAKRNKQSLLIIFIKHEREPSQPLEKASPANYATLQWLHWKKVRDLWGNFSLSWSWKRNSQGIKSHIYQGNDIFSFQSGKSQLLHCQVQDLPLYPSLSKLSPGQLQNKILQCSSPVEI